MDRDGLVKMSRFSNQVWNQEDIRESSDALTAATASKQHLGSQHSQESHQWSPRVLRPGHMMPSRENLLFFCSAGQTQQHDGAPQSSVVLESWAAGSLVLVSLCMSAEQRSELPSTSSHYFSPLWLVEVTCRIQEGQKKRRNQHIFPSVRLDGGLDQA